MGKGLWVFVGVGVWVLVGVLVPVLVGEGVKVSVHAGGSVGAAGVKIRVAVTSAGRVGGRRNSGAKLGSSATSRPYPATRLVITRSATAAKV